MVNECLLTPVTTRMRQTKKVGTSSYANGQLDF